ncbi:helix-turn-helix transcriptional regulator [Streptomyces sp. cg35]|uniref:helix-turn-helix transcriptional regulator n=1 Tax=Streptomyces sp. cg35 TaxID=3421650 RepID=UPI003D17C5E5
MSTELARQLRATGAMLLHETGMTQAELAEALGVSQAQIGRRRSGATPWGIDDCVLLAACFDIDVMDLLAGPSPACHAVQQAQPSPGTPAPN